jgi:hypothetical protein
MRSRPKQVNYLAKHQQASHQQNQQASHVRDNALRSADRIIGKNASGTTSRAPGIVPKKPAGVASRSARPGPARGQAVMGSKPKAIEDDADDGPQGSIKQFVSLDDMPDEWSGYTAPMGSFASNNSSSNKDGNEGYGSHLNGLQGEDDYWAQPVAQPRAAPSSAGNHFGRTNADETGDHWGMPQMGMKNKPAPQRAMSPLIVQDAEHHVGASMHVQHEPIGNQPIGQPIRRNGEYNAQVSPRGLQDGPLSPRGQPAQNIIPRMPTMQPMRRSVDDDMIGGYSVPAPTHNDNDHGFSPPPKARHEHPRNIQQRPVQQVQKPHQPHSFGLEPSPRGDYDVGVMHKPQVSPRGEPDVGVMRKKPPPLPAMMNVKSDSGNQRVQEMNQNNQQYTNHNKNNDRNSQHQFANDDEDEWVDEPRSARGGGGSDGYANQYGLQRGIGSEWSANEYDDDSVEPSPRRNRSEVKGSRKSGIPLVHNIHPKADFHNKYTGLNADDVVEKERNPNSRRYKGPVKKYGEEKAPVRKSGPHVRKGAPQIVSPRSSLDEVNPYAPPLPSDVSTALQHELPKKDMLHYSKAPRKIEYKPYTLQDYKEIKGKGELRDIPKLQPDLNSEELIAKRANKERVKEFSRQLKDFNRQEIKQKDISKIVAGGDGYEKKASILSKRERALEYGKKVRNLAQVSQIESSKQSEKAKSRVGGYSEDDWHGEPDFGDDLYVVSSDPSGQNYEKAKEIEELESKHNDSKRQIDAIKRALKL